MSASHNDHSHSHPVGHTDSHGGVIPDTRHDKHDKHDTHLDKHDKHDTHLDKHDKHDSHKDKGKHTESAFPTPHDNKEVPGRHRDELHSEPHKHGKGHDILNTTHADAHHTTYQDQNPVSKYPPHSLYTVRQDHDVFRSNLERLLSIDAFHGHDRDVKQRLLNDTIALITQHNVASEVVIYRAIKKIDKNKARVARSQAIEIEKILYDIDQEYGAQVDKPKFYEKFRDFDALFMKHLVDDEREIISVLEQQFTIENIDSLNSWFDKVKKLSPTRPEADGNRSVGKKLSSGAAAGFVEQMKDKGKKFTK